MAKRLILQHWKTKCMAPFIQWIEDLVALATYELIAHRCRLYIDKYDHIMGLIYIEYSRLKKAAV